MCFCSLFFLLLCPHVPHFRLKCGYVWCVCVCVCVGERGEGRGGGRGAWWLSYRRHTFLLRGYKKNALSNVTLWMQTIEQCEKYLWNNKKKKESTENASRNEVTLSFLLNDKNKINVFAQHLTTELSIENLCGFIEFYQFLIILQFCFICLLFCLLSNSKTLHFFFLFFFYCLSDNIQTNPTLSFSNPDFVPQARPHKMA